MISYNFRLDPSLTLGCGTWGGNSISENVEPTHLLNIKTVASAGKICFGSEYHQKYILNTEHYPSLFGN
ncbi:MAG UNVERIFIED_CONTAM: hypothetical protein LVR29_23075 [Microcystis novacekii LVE1205-3]